MVSYKEIKASNSLLNDATTPRVAVFAGGTAGIGQLTVKALVATGASVRVYLVGRKSSEERMQAFIQELRAINPKAEVIWAEAEISLLAETKRVCEIIKAKESHVDLLFLTAGFAPFNGRAETAEGLGLCQSLAYYSRILFVLQLLPLLREAEAPRVVSVLGGGMERAGVDLDDLDLEKPGNFGPMRSQTQVLAMNTMTLEKLAGENPGVTFMHSWPGSVNTGNVRRGVTPGSIMAWVIWFVLEPIIYLISTTDEEAAQRHLFQSTSAAFGGRGTSWRGKPGINSLGKPENGLFLVNYKCDCTPNAKVVSKLRDKSMDIIWDHTQEILGPHL